LSKMAFAAPPQIKSARLICFLASLSKVDLMSR
jgi:hypothetical protein